MVYAWFSAYDTNKLHFVEEGMNGKMYRNILDKYLLLAARMMKLKQGWTFKQVIDPKHSQGNSTGFQERNLARTVQPTT